MKILSQKNSKDELIVKMSVKEFLTANYMTANIEPFIEELIDYAEQHYPEFVSNLKKELIATPEY